MKKIILSLFVVTLFGCSKKNLDDITIKSKTSVKEISVYCDSLCILSKQIEAGIITGKFNKKPYNTTSYELRKTNLLINIDSLRNVFGIKNIGRWNGTNNYGFVYVDMNNDGFEDVFYPYSSDGEFNTKPDVFLFNGKTYNRDNSMLPNDYLGNQNTRKTIVGDFNNDSLPDLFLINHGYEKPNYYPGETNTLFLSDKTNGKYKLGDLSMLGKDFWHGGASGDLNGDGNIDIVLSAGKPILLLGNGKGGFTKQNVDFKNDNLGAYITIEIMDVDKNGTNDIVMSGDEGQKSNNMVAKSTILLNNNLTFEKLDITEPNTLGWKLVMDIAVEDIDNDGVKEVFLCRTQDNTGIWYNGYTINIYKKDGSGYKDVTERFIKNNKYTANRTYSGFWMYQIHLKKEMDGLYAIYGYVVEQSKIQYWKQNPTTKTFE
jgi:hypothetical protein